MVKKRGGWGLEDRVERENGIQKEVSGWAKDKFVEEKRRKRERFWRSEEYKSKNEEVKDFEDVRDMNRDVKRKWNTKYSGRKVNRSGRMRKEKNDRWRDGKDKGYKNWGRRRVCLRRA